MWVLKKKNDQYQKKEEKMNQWKIKIEKEKWKRQQMVISNSHLLKKKKLVSKKKGVGGLWCGHYVQKIGGERKIGEHNVIPRGVG